MKNVKLFERVGSFAENKDVARDIRIKEIVPAIEMDEDVVLDFDKIDAATQSFIHALISDLIREYGNNVLEKINFKSCNENVQKIIMIVTDYMQEGV